MGPVGDFLEDINWVFCINTTAPFTKLIPVWSFRRVRHPTDSSEPRRWFYSRVSSYWTSKLVDSPCGSLRLEMEWLESHLVRQLDIAGHLLDSLEDQVPFSFENLSKRMSPPPVSCRNLSSLKCCGELWSSHCLIQNGCNKLRSTRWGFGFLSTNVLCFQRRIRHLFVSRNIERYHFIKQDVAEVLPLSFPLAGFHHIKSNFPNFSGFPSWIYSGRNPKGQPIYKWLAVKLDDEPNLYEWEMGVSPFPCI